MKTCFLFALFVCLLVSAQAYDLQSASQDQIVTLYQLKHHPPKKAHDLFVRATGLLKRHQLQPGLDLLQQAMVIDPGYWEVQNDIGWTYLAIHDRASAERAFQRAIDIDPENPVAYANLGIVALGWHEYDLAQQSAMRALRINPLLAPARVLLALTSISRDEWTPAARKLLEQTQDQMPVSGELLSVWPRQGQRAPHVVVLTAAIH